MRLPCEMWPRLLELDVHSPCSERTERQAQQRREAHVAEGDAQHDAEERARHTDGCAQTGEISPGDRGAGLTRAPHRPRVEVRTRVGAEHVGQHARQGEVRFGDRPIRDLGISDRDDLVEPLPRQPRMIERE